MGDLHHTDRLLNAADLQEIRSLEESLWQAQSRFHQGTPLRGESDQQGGGQ